MSKIIWRQTRWDAGMSDSPYITDTDASGSPIGVAYSEGLDLRSNPGAVTLAKDQTIYSYSPDSTSNIYSAVHFGSYAGFSFNGTKISGFRAGNVSLRHTLSGAGVSAVDKVWKMGDYLYMHDVAGSIHRVLYSAIDQVYNIADFTGTNVAWVAGQPALPITQPVVVNTITCYYGCGKKVYKFDGTTVTEAFGMDSDIIGVTVTGTYVKAYTKDKQYYYDFISAVGQEAVSRLPFGNLRYVAQMGQVDLAFNVDNPESGTEIYQHSGYQFDVLKLLRTNKMTTSGGYVQNSVNVAGTPFIRKQVAYFPFTVLGDNSNVYVGSFGKTVQKYQNSFQVEGAIPVGTGTQILSMERGASNYVVTVFDATVKVYESRFGSLSDSSALADSGVYLSNVYEGRPNVDSQVEQLDVVCSIESGANIIVQASVDNGESWITLMTITDHTKKHHRAYASELALTGLPYFNHLITRVAFNSPAGLKKVSLYDVAMTINEINQ